jgi:exopolysaccharide biosynthesis polyprenyl glycosylphosphotransferase
MKSLWRSPFLTLTLLLADTIALWQLWVSSHALRRALDSFFSQPINPLEGYADAIPWLLLIWLAALARFGFYSHHERIASLNRLGPILWAVIWITIGCTVYNLLFKPDFGRSVIAFFGFGAFIWLIISRGLFRRLKRRAVEKGHGRVRVLVVGGGELGRETILRIREHPDIGFRLEGYIKADPRDEREDILGYPALGRLDDIIPVIQRHNIEEVFLAVPDMKEDDTFSLMEKLQAERSVVCKVVANMLFVIANRAKVDEITGLPVIAFRDSRLPRWQRVARRLLDLAGGLLLATASAPFALLFALLIKLDSKGPILFVHERVGRDGLVFRMWKFRTMLWNCEPYADAPQDQSDPRITRLGRFLRKTSLDEIPQVLNVLRGDMSLVGPRPEMPFIVQTYTEWQKTRLRVKPGLTGLWQVAGRKNLPLHQNLEYDYYYVKNQSLLLDAEILLRTVPAVLLGRGAY